MQKIAQTAGIIVLYFPDSQKLRQLIESIKSQLSLIIVINNGMPTSEIDEICKNTQLINFDENLGIAHAHNFGINLARNEKMDFVLLLDQDSILKPGTVDKLIEAHHTLEQSGKKVASIAPIHRDKKNGAIGPAIKYTPIIACKKIPKKNATSVITTDFNISSGSLIKVENINKIGPMMSELFIDWVDIEWGLRAKSLGYPSFMLQTVEMEHDIGDENTKFLGRSVNLHNDLRNFYILRNATFLLRKKTMGWAWRIYTAIRIPKYYAFFLLTSKNKRKSFRTLAIAIWNGYAGKMGRAEI